MTDTLARSYAENLRQRFGQPFIVENKPGASLMIGTNAVAKAAPDGYTILLTVTTHSQNPHLQPSLPYDSLKDFVPLARTNLTQGVLAVNADLGVGTVQEFAAAAKSGKFSYGTFGVGTSPHIFGRVLEDHIGVDMLHVPFKGEAPVLQDILAGQITTSFLSTMVALPHIRSGRLNALAVSGNSRAAQMEDVPTLRETGRDGFEMMLWTGFLAPAGTPPDVVASLSDALVDATNDAVIKKRIQDAGLIPAPLGSEEFAKYMAQQHAGWGDAIRKTGITLAGS